MPGRSWGCQRGCLVFLWAVPPVLLPQATTLRKRCVCVCVYWTTMWVCLFSLPGVVPLCWFVLLKGHQQENRPVRGVPHMGFCLCFRVASFGAALKGHRKNITEFVSRLWFPFWLVAKVTFSKCKLVSFEELV